jgi:hypothetical protein
LIPTKNLASTRRIIATAASQLDNGNIGGEDGNEKLRLRRLKPFFGKK